MAFLCNRPRSWLVIAVAALLPACTFTDAKLLSVYVPQSAPGAERRPTEANAEEPSVQEVDRPDQTEVAKGNTNAMGETGSPADVSCGPRTRGEYGQIGVIRFGATHGRFEAPLKAAVVRLKDLRPELGFHLVLKIPERFAADRSGADEAAARQRIETVVSAMVNMQVPEKDIIFSGMTSAQAAAHELHVFPMRICREPTARGTGRLPDVDE